MLESEKLAMAAHLHVAMRRKLGRVVDVEWLVRNDDYAREIIRIASAEHGHPEIQQWAGRLQTALFAAAPPAPLVPQQPPTPKASAPARYVGRLR